VIITTPSGLRGDIRGLTGRDGRFLTDMRVNRSNMIPDYILKSCWLKTDDPGPYSNLAVVSEGGESFPAPNWGKSLAGDRDSTLVDIRIESFGPEYIFKVQCENGSCQDRYEWSIDLSELPRRMLSKEDREVFRAGNRFEGKLPGTDRDIVFRLITGDDQRRAAETRKQERLQQKKRGRGGKPQQDDEPNLLLESVLLHTVSIDGIEIKAKGVQGDIERRRKHAAFFDDQPMRVIAGLLDMYDSHGCGIETTIETVCPSCEHAQDQPLPFAGDFFFPRASSRVVGDSTMKKETGTETDEDLAEAEKEVEQRLAE